MKYVSVRVVNGSGNPVTNAKVIVWVYQTAASGAMPAEYTSSDGTAEFALDIDTFAQISISVNGTEKVRRSSVQGQYTIHT